MEDFGKDLGLVHEAVITGRKVGAGKEFWAALAENVELFPIFGSIARDVVLLKEVGVDPATQVCEEQIVSVVEDFLGRLKAALDPSEGFCLGLDSFSPGAPKNISLLQQLLPLWKGDERHSQISEAVNLQFKKILIGFGMHSHMIGELGVGRQGRLGCIKHHDFMKLVQSAVGRRKRIAELFCK